MTHFFNKISIAIKLNNNRKLLLRYIEEIAIPKTKSYLNDYESAKFYINNYYSIVVEKNSFEGKVNRKYDLMPMFNSEVIKTISNDLLFRVLFKKNDFAKIIDIVYSIEYLKLNLPINICNNFTDDIKNHLQEQNIKPKDANEHLKDCPYLNDNTNNYLIRIENYCLRASALNAELDEILKKYNGKSFFWTIKYLFK